MLNKTRVRAYSADYYNWVKKLSSDEFVRNNVKYIVRWDPFDRFGGIRSPVLDFPMGHLYEYLEPEHGIGYSFCKWLKKLFKGG